ncbi:2Fe-2S iron-sulfur cluster-binding protein [Gordoniibacillus kamchatkensis]|uniref:2Fe-2S iron-sulfur cluster-binding protein n=1 Tax=Gordoniibacillus kamchatkensis TaxID=1590651 RepID=UPI000AEE74B7|nr:2Fe-2S iron-sulfur cluster-binding protein [Paenibacillus sp. VKM B-2647]
MGPKVTFAPSGRTIAVRPGTSLLDAAGRAKVPIRVRCGGKASCLMCKVKVPDQSGLAPMNHNERLKLGTLADEGIRLACQARVKGDVTAIIPEDPLKAAIRAQLAKQREEE